MEIGQLSSKYRQETSYNGFTIDILKSALQKYIRRSNPVKAIYAGIELDLFVLIEAEGIRTNFIHRLMIIYLEDISNPGLWIWMNTQIFRLLDLRKKRKSLQPFSKEFCKIRKEEISIVPRIIYELSSCIHSRENSFYNFVFNSYFRYFKCQEKMKEKFTWFYDIEKIPKNTPKKRIITGLPSSYQIICDYFVAELEKRSPFCIYYAHSLSLMEKLPKKFSNSNNPSYLIFYLIENTLQSLYQNDSLKYMKKLCDIGIIWFKEISPLKEEYLTWQNILLIIIKNSSLNIFEEEPKFKDKLHLMYYRNTKNIPVKFDEYVYDMHTKVGRKHGKTSSYFALESSKVTNEDPTINKDYKEAYIYSKLISDPNYCEKESEYFEFIVRAQLVTGNGKTDTYFANENGKLVFVKGPFESLEQIQDFMKIQKDKKRLGLQTLNYRVVELCPDLFTNTPLGKRKSLDKTKKYPFLVCDTLFNGYDIPTKLHSSKVWEETEVVDWNKVDDFTHLEDKSLQDEIIFRQFCENVIFRYVYGIGDLAKRNFIIKKKKVYSIDEDSFLRDFDLKQNLHTKYQFFLKYIQSHKEHFINFLQKIPENMNNHRYLEIINILE